MARYEIRENMSLMTRRLPNNLLVIRIWRSLATFRNISGNNC